jgi:hypothetical protein
MSAHQLKSSWQRNQLTLRSRRHDQAHEDHGYEVDVDMILTVSFRPCIRLKIAHRIEPALNTPANEPQP